MIAAAAHKIAAFPKSGRTIKEREGDQTEKPGIGGNFNGPGGPEASEEDSPKDEDESTGLHVPVSNGS